MKRLLFCALFLALAVPSLGADIYFGPTSAGSNNGTSCANRYAYNDATNGIDGTGTASWVAGNTLHLCAGTWTGGNAQQWILTRGSGASGNPITITFEAGAVLSAPYHAYTAYHGAVTIQNSYITVDGGTNGIIQNTANGTNGSPHCINGSCSTQQNSILVGIISPASNVEIKNLTLGDVYVHDYDTNPNDTLGGDNYCVLSLGHNDVTINHNTCHDANGGFAVWGTNAVISYNTAYNNGHGDIVSGTNIATSGMEIHDNRMTKSCNWFTTSDTYHLNNIHFFNNLGVGDYSDVRIYNNLFAGGCLLGAQTAHLQFEGGFESLYAFNNVFDNRAIPGDVYNPGALPYFFPGISIHTNSGTYVNVSPTIVNNTFIGGDYTSAGFSQFAPVLRLTPNPNLTGLTFQNNIVTTGKSLASLQGAGLWDATNFAVGGMDYNAYDNHNDGADLFAYSGVGYHNLIAFGNALPVGSGKEANSIYDSVANLKINADGTLQALSPLIAYGPNLTALCVGTLVPLCSDYLGVARPAVGNWDLGAYAYAAAGSPAVGLSTRTNTFLRSLVGINSADSPFAVTMTNPGTALLNITSIVASAGFSQTNDCGASLAAGLSCTIQITATPVMRGNALAGTVTITTDASTSPDVIDLTASASASIGGATFRVGVQ